MAKARKTRTRTKAKEKPQTPAVKLAAEPNVPMDNFTDYVTVIMGESGIGKTTLAAQIPGNYFFQFDPNRRGLKIRQSLIKDVSIRKMRSQRPEMTPWQEFQALIDQACNDDSIQVVVIDNFGLCYESCLRHRCYKLGISDPSEEQDFGQTWRDIKDDFTTTLNEILYAEKGLFILTHDTSKEVSLPSGNKYERVQPSMTKGAFDWLKACSDFAFYYCYGDDGDRTFLLRGDKEVWTKCCNDPTNPHFYDPEGNPVRSIPAGNTASEAWENLNKSWNNELFDIDYTPKSKKRRMKSRGSRKIVSE